MLTGASRLPSLLVPVLLVGRTPRSMGLHGHAFHVSRSAGNPTCSTTMKYPLSPPTATLPSLAQLLSVSLINISIVEIEALHGCALITKRLRYGFHRGGRDDDGFSLCAPF